MSIVEGEAPLDAAQRDALLDTLLRRHPGGVVAAMDADGRLVRCPASIELSGQRTSRFRTPLDVIAPECRRTVFEQLETARSKGAATLRVNLVNGLDSTCHIVDVRHSHGVLIGLITNDFGVDLAASLDATEPLVPKTGRMTKDGVAMILSADDRIGHILGYEPDDLVGRRSIDLIHPDDHERALDAWLELIAHPGGTTRLRARHRRGNGSWVWLELTNENLLDGDEQCIVTEMLDVTEEMEAIEHLRQREEVLTRLTEALPSGVLQIDIDRHVIHSNARLHHLVGVGATTTFEAQFATVVADDRVALDAALDDVLSTGRDVELEVRLELPGARSQHRASIAMRALTDGRDVPVGALVCVDDVTDASALRAELQRRATIDELTGCLNRAAILEALDARLGMHRSAAAGTAVVFLDLDGFKIVNDTFGHHAGDQLLATVAARITSVLRVGDLVGRLGGDEFLVLASAIASREDAMAFAVRIRDALDEPVDVDGGLPMRVRSSIGVAWSRAPRVTATELTAAADRAMYQSKRTGFAEPVAVAV